MIPFAKENNVISIAVADPQNYTALQALKFIFQEKKLSFELFVSLEKDIKEALRKAENLTSAVTETLEEFNQHKLKISDVDLENVYKELEYFTRPIITKNIFEF